MMFDQILHECEIEDEHERIDAIIKDEHARIFWKKYFMKRVPSLRFVRS